MKKTIITVVCLMFLLITVSALHAQTNSAPASNSVDPQDLAIADAARLLILAVLAKFSGISSAKVIGAIYLASKFLRNRTPLGTGKLAPVLNWINFEAKAAGSTPANTPTK